MPLRLYMPRLKEALQMLDEGCWEEVPLLLLQKVVLPRSPLKPCAGCRNDVRLLRQALRQLGQAERMPKAN